MTKLEFKSERSRKAWERGTRSVAVTQESFRAIKRGATLFFEPGMHKIIHRKLRRFGCSEEELSRVKMLELEVDERKEKGERR